MRSEFEKEAYWRDVGTVDAYWEANIDLTAITPALDIYDTEWPIWTYSELVAPAKFVHDEDERRGHAISSLVSGGCIVSGTEMRRSLLFTGVRTHSYSTIEDAVILPYVQVGRHVRLKGVVIDRGVKIPDNLVVGEDAELDASRFRRTEKGRVPDHAADDRCAALLTWRAFGADLHRRDAEGAELRRASSPLLCGSSAPWAPLR